MANLLLSSSLFLVLLSLTTTMPSLAHAKAYEFLVSEKPAPKPVDEKLSHFRVYWHDIVSGPSPTSIRVAEAPTTNSSATLFGAVIVIDDPLTVGPEITSELVGRAEGLYAADSKELPAIIMAMNFVFLGGKYNRSSITILGRNEVLLPIREMPIVGGSGLFRMARGYVQAQTYSLNPSTGDAVVEYNIYVIH
ncbi:dirigent protein 22-like [Typha angustifolia]|uniref:dirigent protein 22-like n=1 Tax=Typha angustifolia TaxID=59011 RepID=UPI003C2FBD5A